MEFANLEGLRQDGRRLMEMRKLKAQVGVVAKADGWLNTKVIAAARFQVLPASINLFFLNLQGCANKPLQSQKVPPKANSPLKIYNTSKNSEKADRRQRKNLVMAESSQLFEEKSDLAN
ncbi:hypothetical protein NC652_006782 [Populus alba x Populus x berolinensis]|nr:hypothetical protein NC652_006782 [Populus alba x Populus x berolinensis]